MYNLQTHLSFVLGGWGPMKTKVLYLCIGPYPSIFNRLQGINLQTQVAFISSAWSSRRELQPHPEGRGAELLQGLRFLLLVGLQGAP